MCPHQSFLASTGSLVIEILCELIYITHKLCDIISTGTHMFSIAKLFLKIVTSVNKNDQIHTRMCSVSLEMNNRRRIIIISAINCVTAIKPNTTIGNKNVNFNCQLKLSKSSIWLSF